MVQELFLKYLLNLSDLLLEHRPLFCVFGYLHTNGAFGGPGKISVEKYVVTMWADRALKMDSQK